MTHRLGAALVVESGNVLSAQYYYSSSCFIQHHIEDTESSHHHQVCQHVYIMTSYLANHVFN